MLNFSTEPNMTTLRSKFGNLYYKIEGKGEPLVLLRGITFSTKHWLDYTKTLSRKFKVISLDNRGTGNSTIRPSWGLTVEDMAQDVANILNHEGIAQAHIVGFSLGGMVAISLGQSHPHLANTLTLVNSSIGSTKPQRQRISIEALVKLASNAGFDKRLADTLASTLISPSAPQELKMKTSYRWQKISHQDGWHRLTTLKQGLAALRFKPSTASLKLNIPTHIIFGNEDRFVPPENSFEIYRKIPGSFISSIDGAGHEIFIEKPVELTSSIQSWIKNKRTG